MNLEKVLTLQSHPLKNLQGVCSYNRVKRNTASFYYEFVN